MIFSFPVPSISDSDLSTESSSSDESTEVSDDSSDHTPSSSSESSSESEGEGEGEQTARLTGHPATASAGSREKDQGQMKNSHKQCTHSASIAS